MMKNDSNNSEIFVILTRSDLETINIGRKLGSYLKENDVVALVGELGSGKTWFAKGIALGLGISEETIVTSPSFALVNEYDGRCTFFHMDVYRFDDIEDFFDAGLEEYFHRRGVVAMEWANRWPDVLPPHHIEVSIDIIDDSRREIIFKGWRPHSIEIINSIGKEFNKD